MPVNDSSSPADAEGNCALCTVAGILGSSAEAERRRMEGILGGRIKDASLAFYFWAVIRGLAPKGLTGTNPLKAQIRGVSDYMIDRGGFAPVTIGSVNDPLDEGQVASAMGAMPDGTPFAYLVLNQGMRAHMGAVEAHWLAATHRGGVTGFTDYQLDVPAEQIRFMIRRTNVRNGWGQPSASDGPREAFGQLSRTTNRYLAVGFLR